MIDSKEIDSGSTDEDMTHWVLTFSIPAIGQARSPLEGCLKPARPVGGAAHEVLILTCIARTQIDGDLCVHSNLGFHLPHKFVIDSVKDPVTYPYSIKGRRYLRDQDT
jgi:hypothetical protein